MEFDWSAEQKAVAERIRTFARERLTHNVAEADRESRFPRELWQTCAEFGVQGVNVEAQYGGQGHDVLTSTLAMEALGYGCANTALTLALNAQIWTVQLPIQAFGTEAQRTTYLPRLTSGEAIGVQAVSEPEAGSDVAAAACRADAVAGGYELSGTKTMITGAPHADLAIVLASTDPSLGRWGLSTFLIDLHSAGVHVGEPKEKMGLKSLPFGDISFDGCFVPETALLGQKGAGLGVINAALEWERSCMLACFVGVMARQLDEAVIYAKERHQFGQPIGDFQAVSHRIADMTVRLETARLLLYKAAWMKATGQSAAQQAAMVKLYLSEAFVASSLDAVRTRGGYGYLAEHGAERDLRDAIGSTLYGGTSDILRNMIARLSGL